MDSFGPVLDAILRHFGSDSARQRVRLFSRCARQAEAWFKGEVMTVLEDSKSKKLFDEWQAEVTYASEDASGRSKCDFVLRKEDKLTGLEVKTACVGRQTKRFMRNGGFEEGETQQWDLNFTASAGMTHGKVAGVASDAMRLLDNRHLSEKYCLVFAYGDPSFKTPRGQHTFKDQVEAFPVTVNGILAEKAKVEAVIKGSEGCISLGDDGLILHVIPLRVLHP